MTSSSQLTPPYTLHVLNNDRDPENDPLSLLSSPQDSLDPSSVSNTLVVSVSLVGQHYFTYTISDDDLLTDTARGTLTVGQHLTTLTPDMSRTTTFSIPVSQQTFLIVPPGAVSQNVSLLYTELDPNQINPPPDGFTFSGCFFEINAYLDAVQPEHHSHPVL